MKIRMISRKTNALLALFFFGLNAGAPVFAEESPLLARQEAMMASVPVTQTAPQPAGAAAAPVNPPAQVPGSNLNGFAAAPLTPAAAPATQQTAPSAARTVLTGATQTAAMTTANTTTTLAAGTQTLQSPATAAQTATATAPAPPPQTAPAAALTSTTAPLMNGLPLQTALAAANQQIRTELEAELQVAQDRLLEIEGPNGNNGELHFAIDEEFSAQGLVEASQVDVNQAQNWVIQAEMGIREIDAEIQTVTTHRQEVLALLQILTGQGNSNLANLTADIQNQITALQIQANYLQTTIATLQNIKTTVRLPFLQASQTTLQSRLSDLLNAQREYKAKQKATHRLRAERGTLRARIARITRQLANLP